MTSMIELLGYPRKRLGDAVAPETLRPGAYVVAATAADLFSDDAVSDDAVSDEAGVAGGASSREGVAAGEAAASDEAAAAERRPVTVG